MSDKTYLDAMQVWAYMSEQPFNVWSPGEIAAKVFSSNGFTETSRGKNYRRTINALSALRECGIVGREWFIGTNQSVYWLQEKVK